jgi:hypothetical protein
LPQLLIDEYQRIYYSCDGYYTQFNTYNPQIIGKRAYSCPVSLLGDRDLGAAPSFFKKLGDFSEFYFTNSQVLEDTCITLNDPTLPFVPHKR